MQTIPENILDQFNALLKQLKIPVAAHNDYRKWLRYFLDFRAKYSPPDSRSDQVRLFIEKLRSKKQTTEHLEQAADAVSLFFALQKRLKPFHPRQPDKRLLLHRQCKACTTRIRRCSPMETTWFVSRQCLRRRARRVPKAASDSMSGAASERPRLRPGTYTVMLEPR